MKTSYRQGLKAEKLAALLLRLKGYRILETRFKTPVGEVDLIACRRKSLVFVEVKMRNDKQAAFHAIQPKGKERISKAAAYYMMRHPETQGHSCRFDAILIVPPFFIRHLDNVWEVSPY